MLLCTDVMRKASVGHFRIEGGDQEIAYECAPEGFRPQNFTIGTEFDVIFQGVRLGHGSIG